MSKEQRRDLGRGLILAFAVLFFSLNGYAMATTGWMHDNEPLWEE